MREAALHKFQKLHFVSQVRGRNADVVPRFTPGLGSGGGRLAFLCPRGGCGNNFERNERRVDLRRRRECAGRHGEDDAGPRSELGEDAQVAVSARAGCRRQPFGDLALDEQRHPADTRRVADQMMNDRRSDVIGQVAENKTSIASSATAQFGNIDREDVGVKDFDTRLAPKLLFEFSSQGGVNFKGDHLSRAPGEQDRKSTRLNSSHGYISYAVFCLKKKNTSELITALE